MLGIVLGIQFIYRNKDLRFIVVSLCYYYGGGPGIRTPKGD